MMHRICLAAVAAIILMIGDSEASGPIQVIIDDHGQVTWDRKVLPNRPALEAKLIEFNEIRSKPAINLRLSNPAAFSQLGPFLTLLKKFRFQFGFVIGPRPAPS